MIGVSCRCDHGRGQRAFESDAGADVVAGCGAAAVAMPVGPGSIVRESVGMWGCGDVDLWV